MSERIKEHLISQLAELQQLPIESMLDKRYQRLLSYGN